MRKMTWVTICSLLAAGGIVLAADAGAEKAAQLEKVKTLRTSVLNKMPALTDAFDRDHNGVNPASASYAKLYYATSADLQKQVQGESAKDAEARDQAAIAAWNAKLTRAQARWHAWHNVDGQAWNQKWNALAGAQQNLTIFVTSYSSQYQVWLRAECDPKVVVATFAELDKRADDLKSQASVLAAELVKVLADEERALKE